MERTLSNGSSEECDHTVTVCELPAPIGECPSKCGDDISVKYLVLKTTCKYFSMHITQKQWSAP